MLPPLKPGVTLAPAQRPRHRDRAPEAAAVARRRHRAEHGDAGRSRSPARFITADGKPITDAFVGWRNAAIMAGHWALHGVGMFVVEEKQTGRFAGRVGPWLPPGWPGFEVGWGIASEFRGKGYAVEAARASIDWSFATFEIDQIIHCIDRENTASQAVARRLGAERSARSTCSAMSRISG